MTLGDKLSKDLKKLRESAGRAQAEVAESLEISRATLNRWEGHGAGSVTIDQLERICRLFKVPPNVLLSSEGVTVTPTIEAPLLPVLLEISTLLPALDEDEVAILLGTIRKLASGPKASTQSSRKSNKAR